MKILCAIFAFNEEQRIKDTIAKHPKKRNYDLIIFDDGTTDGSLKNIGEKVISNKTNKGIGYTMKKAFKYAIDNKYDIIVITAGNNKDDAKEIPRLIKPIVNGEAEFVQGSRFLSGGLYGNMPIYRIIATKHVHPILTSIVAGKRVTESTNGFRAIKVSLLKDKAIDWKQDWLDKYELEPYLLIKAIQTKHKHMEVPCSKIYPEKKTTKMTPFVSWWNIMKPILYIGLKVKR